MKANGSGTAWQEPETGPHQLRDEVLSGFRETPRRLASKLLYDPAGIDVVRLSLYIARVLSRPW